MGNDSKLDGVTGASLRDRAVVNGAASVSALRASVPSAGALLPCPFCGGDAAYESRGEWQHYDCGSVECAICGATIIVDADMRNAMANAKTEAIAAWNRRTKTDELRDMFAAHIAGGILAGGWADTVPLDDCTHAEQLAAFAYAGANAMLIEREAYRAADAESRAALTSRPDAIECDVPPAGWFCTRAAGHEGPCAAYAQAMSARQGQDRNGLGATPASAVPAGDAPETPALTTHEAQEKHDGPE